MKANKTTKGDKMKKCNTTTLYCLVMMLTIWCTWNSVKSGNLLTSLSNMETNYNLLVREVSHSMDRLNSLEIAEPKVVEVIKEVEIIKEVEVIKEVKVEDLLVK